MGKSVYSIVLSDEVVQAIDDLAYRLGTSRSRLITKSMEIWRFQTTIRSDHSGSLTG